MPTLNYAVTVSGLGGNIAQSIPRTADGGGIREIAVPVGYAGTLSTRTDEDTGTVTLDGGHAITTGMKVDIYWDGGVQYNVTVGTVATNSMPFDLGVGDDLPVATTAVVVSPRVEFAAAIDGDALELISICQKYVGTSVSALSHVDFQESDGTEVCEIDLQPNGPQVWDIAGGSANAFTGEPIAKGFVSNGSTTTAAVLQLLWLQDTTP